MSERIALIVNVNATRVRNALHRRVSAELRAHGPVDEMIATREHRAGSLTQQALAAGATLVVALGGDGTVNEAAGVLAGTPIPLLPMAGGSTNVFSRAMGWPHPAGSAVPLIGPALEQHHVRSVRLGEVTVDGRSRTFCVNAGAGIDANTVQRVEASRWLKPVLRQLGFGLVSVAESVRSVRREPCITLVADDGDPHLVASAIVATGSPYAFFGPTPLDLTPGAAFDGRLRWLGIAHTGPRDLGRVLAGGLRSASHIGREGIFDGWALREVRLSADRPIAVQADGEPLGRHREAVMRPGPELQVLVPPPAVD